MPRRKTARWCHVIGIVLLLGWAAAEAASPVQAQPDPPAPNRLTLTAAVQEAMEAGTRVRSAKAAEDAAARRASWRTSAYLPQATAAASTNRSQYPQTITPIRELGVFPRLDDTIHELRLSASWTVFDFGQGRAERRAAQALAEAAGVQYDRARMETIEAVAGAFVRLEQLRTLAQAQQARRDALRRQAAQIEDLREEGRVADVERLKIQEVVLDAEADLRATRRQQENMLQALAAELGRRQPLMMDAIQLRPLPVADTLSAVNTNHTDTAVQAPRVAAARARLSAAEARQAEATRALLPFVEIVGAEQMRSGSDWNVDAQWTAGLRVTVPLTPFGATAQRAAQQAATREREFALADAQRQLRVVLAELDNQIQDAADRATTAAAREAQLAETYRIESAAHAEGRLTLTDLLATEAKLAAARSGGAAARAAIAQLRLRRSALTGRLTIDHAVQLIQPAP